MEIAGYVGWQKNGRRMYKYEVQLENVHAQVEIRGINLVEKRSKLQVIRI